MGNAEGDSDEQPVHTVTLSSFWIDQTEVTNRAFATFLNAWGNQEENGVTWLDLSDEDCLIQQVGDEYRPNSGYADYPVVEVTWYGAVAYCEWAGVRLPTEAEWEYAARGPQALIYPWGNEFDCSRGNFDDETQIDNYMMADREGCDGYPALAPVGSFPSGASWCGSLDLAGNVWEWVADWYDEEYYHHSPSQDPLGPSLGEYRLVRGGAWLREPYTARSTYRLSFAPDGSVLNVGFRCVRDSD